MAAGRVEVFRRNALERDVRYSTCASSLTEVVGMKFVLSQILARFYLVARNSPVAFFFVKVKVKIVNFFSSQDGFQVNYLLTCPYRFVRPNRKLISTCLFPFSTEKQSSRIDYF